MVGDSLKFQRWSLAVIAFVIASLAVIILLNVNVASRARRLGNQLRSTEKAASEQQQILEEVSPIDL